MPWIPLVLALGTLLVYWPVFGCGFVNFDDTDFVTANPHVQAGLTLAGFKWVWQSEVARNWHPLTMLSHMLACQIFGLRPAGHHLLNLLLHITNVLLIYFVFRMMTGSVWRSAFVAALFAWHPLHVESVAWIAERKDVLSTFFWLLAIWSYARYARELSSPDSRAKNFYALALVFLACGLMSKPMLVTAPFVFLLLDFWPLRRWGRGAFPLRLLWEKVPMLFMSAALCVVTYLIQQHGGAMLAGTNRPLPLRIENALISYVSYIGKMFWPDKLAGLYLHAGGWPLWETVSAALVLGAVSIMAIIQAGRRPWLAVGWFWYLGALVPVIGLVQVGMQSMADRFTYVPFIGLFLILAWGGYEIARPARLSEKVLAALSGAALVPCMFLTWHQIGFWKDSQTLFDRMIAVSNSNYMAHYNLGNLYTREKKLDQAAANYEAALQGEPNFADAHNNYGGLLLDEKRYDEAIRHYREAVRLNPQYLYYFNLANALADAASARHDANEFAEAVQTYGQALQLNPNSSDAHHNLGLTWEAQGKLPEAVADFQESVRFNPNREDSHYCLGNDLSRLGRLDEAIAEYRAAVRLNPGRAESYNGLGICYAMQNKMADAAEQFRQVIRLQPANAGANGNLANALASQGKLDEAIPYYEAALRLDPRDYQSEFNLGLTLARMARYSDAEIHYRNALRLNPDYAAARQALQQLPNQVNTRK